MFFNKKQEQVIPLYVFFIQITLIEINVIFSLTELFSASK